MHVNCDIVTSLDTEESTVFPVLRRFGIHNVDVSIKCSTGALHSLSLTSDYHYMSTVSMYPQYPPIYCVHPINIITYIKYPSIYGINLIILRIHQSTVSIFPVYLSPAVISIHKSTIRLFLFSS